MWSGEEVIDDTLGDFRALPTFSSGQDHIGLEILKLAEIRPNIESCTWILSCLQYESLWQTEAQLNERVVGLLEKAHPFSLWHWSWNLPDLLNHMEGVAWLLFAQLGLPYHGVKHPDLHCSSHP